MLTCKSLRIHFEARDAAATFMNIFVEPVTEDQVEKIQSTNQSRILEIERRILGLTRDETRKQQALERQHEQWAEIEASVEEAMRTDVLSLTAATPDHGSIIISRDHDDNKEQSHEDMHVENLDLESSDMRTGIYKSGDGDVQMGNSTPETPPSADAGEFPTQAHIQQADQVQNTSESAEVDLDVAADLSFLDSIHESTSATPKGQVSAWTLSIRHNLNDGYIDRPAVLTPADKWKIEYSLAEVTNPQLARNLYQACQLRREAKMKEIDLDEESPYRAMIRSLSEAGASWRKELDAAEEGKPKLTLTPSTSGKAH